MLTSFKFLSFLCAFLCIFSAYTANALEAEDWDDSCWEFGPEDYLEDDDDEDDEEEECRCLWSEEDLAKAAEYDKIVEEIEGVELNGNFSSEAQPRGLGKWFAKRVKKMFMKFVGLKKVKNLDEMAYQMVRFNRKVGKFVKVPGIDKMIKELSTTELSPEIIETVCERLKYYKKHKHAKPQNNKNSRFEGEFRMNDQIVWGSMEVVIGMAMLPFPGINVCGKLLIGSGVVSISMGMKEYFFEYMDHVDKQCEQNRKPMAVVYRFRFKCDEATEGLAIAA